MEIHGADLRGIDGELIRFRVLGEPDGNGIHVLGNARRVTAQGTIERCLNAIHTMQGFEAVGAQMRYTVDLTPVEAMVQSPGIDLPLAITLLRATVQQNLEDLRRAISEQEAKLEKYETEHAKASDQSKRKELRKRILAVLEAYRAQLANAEQYQQRLAGNVTEYLLIGKLDITTGAIESPRDGMLGLIASVRPNMTVIVPEGAEVHAAIVANGVEGVTAYKARDITEVWSVITGVTKGRVCRATEGRIAKKETVRDAPLDLKEIIGNGRAKLALETALAGRHALLFVGPAGHGKSMLAQAAIQLLPELERHEILEVNKIYSARAELSSNQLILKRPYQAVSNSVTEAALFGGGIPLRPGLVSAAHRGILFFDEVNLTPEAVLEKLRDPWSSGAIAIQRANGSTTIPSRFQFIGAMNPCKCAMHFHYRCGECGVTFLQGQKCKEHPKAPRKSACSCSPRDVERYLGRLSQPIKDRIDIVCLVSQYDQREIWYDHQSSRTVQSRITAAWERQRERYRKHERITCNSDVPNISKLLETGAITADVEKALKKTLAERKITLDSLRKLTQLLSLSRTVADLAGSARVTTEHINQTIAISGLEEGLLDPTKGRG